MSQPGRLPSGETRGFALWHDLTASILAAAGTTAPQTMQGYDLYTPLTSGGPTPRRYAAASLFKSAAVATGRWKMEYYFEDGCGRLFDRIEDPQEQLDLWNVPDLSPIRRLCAKFPA